MKMKKWMATALIIALVAVNNLGMEQVNGFTSLDFAKNEASDLSEQNTDLSPVSTVTPEGIESYYVTYIDRGEEIHVGCYETGKTATITLDERNDNDFYRFVGWKDYKGDIHQSGKEVTIYDIPSATFTAVWEKIAEPTTPSAIPVETAIPTATFTAVWEKIVETENPGVAPIITVTPNAISGETSSITPTETPTPTSKPNVKPVIKKAKVKITTNAKKKFIVGKKYTIKANRSNTKEKMQWAVTNKKIATINKNTGVLKAKKAGKVTITVISSSRQRNAQREDLLKEQNLPFFITYSFPCSTKF